MIAKVKARYSAREIVAGIKIVYVSKAVSASGSGGRDGPFALTKFMKPLMAPGV
jgi:hypothetical protein